MSNIHKLNHLLGDAHNSAIYEGVDFERIGPKTYTNLGQLSLKKEAAGKVRVFAMVDFWTQSLLRPLHDYLASFLKNLPNDGTFDQSASVKRCFDKAEKAGYSLGYDLSAATDRLPIYLQMTALESLFGAPFAIAWARLLTGRKYHLHSKEFSVNESLSYAVGQPMGAHSSWPMLAITHHLIVQLAARRAVGHRISKYIKTYE